MEAFSRATLAVSKIPLMAGARNAWPALALLSTVVQSSPPRKLRDDNAFALPPDLEAEVLACQLRISTSWMRCLCRLAPALQPFIRNRQAYSDLLSHGFQTRSELATWICIVTRLGKFVVGLNTEDTTSGDQPQLDHSVLSADTWRSIVPSVLQVRI